MPIYVYKCDACGKTHEILQRFSDPPLAECPDCGGSVKKQFTGEVGLHFNGSGFYITDYVRKKDKSSDESKKESKSTSEAASTAD